MDRKTYRLQVVEAQNLDNAEKFEQGKEINERGFFLLASIHAEIAPKLKAKRMAEAGLDYVEESVSRWHGLPVSPFNPEFREANSTDGVRTYCGKGYMPENAGVSKADTDSDLAQANSNRFDTVRAELEAKDSQKD